MNLLNIFVCVQPSRFAYIIYYMSTEDILKLRSKEFVRPKTDILNSSLQILENNLAFDTPDTLITSSCKTSPTKYVSTVCGYQGAYSSVEGILDE